MGTYEHLRSRRYDRSSPPVQCRAGVARCRARASRHRSPGCSALGHDQGGGEKRAPGYRLRSRRQCDSHCTRDLVVQQRRGRQSRQQRHRHGNRRGRRDHRGAGRGSQGHGGGSGGGRSSGGRHRSEPARGALKDDGAPAAPVPVTWKSLRPDIASVDQNGVIVALAPGQGTVQVTSAGLTATAPVVVQQSDVSVQEPVPLVMSPGDVDTLHVTVPTQGGRLVSALALQWSTADASVARVNLTGVVTAVAPGHTTLTVAGLLQTKTVEVVVHRTVEQLAVSPTYKVEVPLPIQGTVKVTVQGLAVDKTPVPEAQFRWTVADTSLAGFDPASGTLTGKRAGKTTLTVKGPGPGLTVTWPIRVIAAGLKLSASRLGVPLARRVPLRASFADESGAVIGPATGVTWASDNPSVATVSEDGTVTTAAYGHARITATAPGGRHAVAEVFVQGEIVVASTRSGRYQLYAAERANLAQLRKVMDDTAT